MKQGITLTIEQLEDDVKALKEGGGGGTDPTIISRIETLERSSQAQSTAIAGNTQDINDLEDDITGLQGTTNELQAEIDSNSSNIATNTTNITNLTSVVDTNTNNISGLTTRITNAEDDIDVLETTAENHNTRITTAQNTADGAVSMNTTQNSQITSLDNRVTALENSSGGGSDFNVLKFEFSTDDSDTPAVVLSSSTKSQNITCYNVKSNFELNTRYDVLELINPPSISINSEIIPTSTSRDPWDTRLLSVYKYGSSGYNGIFGFYFKQLNFEVKISGSSSGDYTITKLIFSID